MSAKESTAKSAAASESSMNSAPYAILASGSKQQIVREGDVIAVEKIGAAEGEKVTLNEVLFVRGTDSVAVGKPFVDGAKVMASVVGEDKGPKLTIMHKKRRKHSMTKNGHRQQYTLLSIDSIDSAGGAS